MKKTVFSANAIAAAAVLATGCSTVNESAGSSKRTPDEFRVVRKAPLTVPPEYALRPPAPGESRPQELRPDAQAKAAIFGADFGKDASEGEKLLVQKAGGAATDPKIRAQVDYDASGTLRKGKSFSDRILYFNKNDGAPGTGDEAISEEDEAARIKREQDAIENSTGGGDVVIQRKASSKLPGL